MLEGAQSNGDLILTISIDHEQETIANMRKERNEARREQDRGRRNSLTTKKREEMNAQRRAARQKKTIDERNAHQRQARKNLTTKERQEMNAHRRQHWQNIPPEKKQALLAQRNARLVDWRNTLCAESIAMPCPYGATMPSSSWN